MGPCAPQTDEPDSTERQVSRSRQRSRSVSRSRYAASRRRRCSTIAISTIAQKLTTDAIMNAR